MADPEITIGIAFHNPGPFFDAALRSVFSQTLSSWELLLVDDGSQDASLELARSLHDPRVRVLSDGRHLGLAKRLNQITQLARAPWLARMDSDDLMHPARLEMQLQALKGAQTSTVLGSCAYAIDSHDQVVGFKHSRPPAGLATEHTFIHPTILAATAWFRQHPYSEDPAFVRCEDAELWLRGAGDTTYAVLQQPLLYYREIGTFSLANYLATQRGLREIARRESGASWGRRQRRLMQLHLKSLAARALTWAGGSERMTRRRSRPLQVAEQALAQGTLAEVLASQLPVHRL
jgi:glycosyltransferase involved in cell wall biosynthesis